MLQLLITLEGSWGPRASNLIRVSSLCTNENVANSHKTSTYSVDSVQYSTVFVEHLASLIMQN